MAITSLAKNLNFILEQSSKQLSRKKTESDIRTPIFV